MLRGGGIIFTIALWIWSIWYGFQYPWLLAGVTLAAGISFVDDIHSLPDSLRLVVQFASMFMVFQEVGLLQWDMWWIVACALIACVGATNIYNFMDGINGITGGYSLAMLIPLFLLNRRYAFMEESLLIAIYVIPDTVAAHWAYLVCSALVMGVAYILFKMKYYHLHEEYLTSIKKQ